MGQPQRVRDSSKRPASRSGVKSRADGGPAVRSEADHWTFWRVMMKRVLEGMGLQMVRDYTYRVGALRWVLLSGRTSSMEKHREDTGRAKRGSAAL